MPARVVACVLGGLLLLTGCSMGSAIQAPQEAVTTSVGPQPAPVRPATKLALSAGSCWSGQLLGSDPQLALRLAATFGITYFDAAYALEDRPAFDARRPCAGAHAIEVYRLVPASSVSPRVTDYTALMRTSTIDFAQISAAVDQACMDRTLAAAARRSGVTGAWMQPALPDGMRIRWAPATFEQWQRGQRVFACMLTQDKPSSVRFAALRTSALPTQLRTCIASGPRIYVDCARKHDRERIAVLDVSAAVRAGTFPLRYQHQGAAFYRPLDRACTAYLRMISTGHRLSGVAEIDPDVWPDADGAYRISCEADTPPNRASLVTQGSVYNRAFAG